MLNNVYIIVIIVTSTTSEGGGWVSAYLYLGIVPNQYLASNMKDVHCAETNEKQFSDFYFLVMVFSIYNLQVTYLNFHDQKK